MKIKENKVLNRSERDKEVNSEKIINEYRHKLKKLKWKRVFKRFGTFIGYYIIYILILLLLFKIVTFCVFGTCGAIINKLSQKEITNIVICLITVGFGFTTYYSNKRSKYNDIITKSRLEWVREVRELVNKFVYLIIDQSNKSQKYYKNANEASEDDNDIKNAMYKNSPEIKSIANSLILYFNPCGGEEKEIMILIDCLVEEVRMNDRIDGERIRHKADEKRVKDDIKELLSKVGLYLKCEWETIKDESR